MKTLCILFSLVSLTTTFLFGQDRFPVTQMTAGEAQKGFASFSPDGGFIVYSVIEMNDSLGKTGLWRIPSSGGSSVQLFSGIAEHPKWSPDGRWIVFDADSGNSIQMIPAKGGKPVRVVPDSIRIQNGGLPCWSPDASRIAFMGGEPRTLWVADINQGTFRKIFQEEGVLPLPGGWTTDGKEVLAGVLDRQTRKSTMWRVAADGSYKTRITPHHDGFFRHMALSPDGSILVYAAAEDRILGLWAMPAEGGKSLPLAITEGNHNEGACWSPDGTKIAFNSTRSGNFDIWMMDVDPARLHSDLQTVQQDGEPVSIGSYKTIHSRILDEERLLYIHLPKEYDDTRLDYPVLYLLYADLYNYFTDAVMVTEKLGGTGEVPPVILVGVANTDRYRDLLPYPSAGRGEGGGAGNFLRFLQEELIPYVDSAYRTNGFRILAAPQAAAVFSLYALITRPGLFQATLAQNPLMNPDNAGKLYPQAVEFLSRTDTLRHLYYVSCEQSDHPELLDAIKQLQGEMEQYPPDGFRFVLDIREPSGYFIPPLPFKEALRMLFPGYRLPEGFKASSLQQILDYYSQRSDEYGFTAVPPEHMLTFQGAGVSQQGQYPEAIRVFEYQLSLYPQSLNALFQLGEIYRAMGEYATALAYYNRFLEIRSVDAAMIQQRVKEMEERLER